MEFNPYNRIITRDLSSAWLGAQEEDKPQIGIRCNSNFSIILNAVKVDAAIAASTTLTNDTVGEIKENDARL